MCFWFFHWLQVDKSRKMCDLVDKGDIDLAIIGGDAPAELQHVLRVVPYAQVCMSRLLAWAEQSGCWMFVMLDNHVCV